MNDLDAIVSGLPAPDPAAAEAVQRRLDRKTRPRGSLGRLEELACRLAAIQGTSAPRAERKAVVVLAADHGVAGASPEEVTGRGTGIDDAGWRRRVEVVRRALAANPIDARDPVGVLGAVGGFELAGLAGVVLGAAARRRPVVAGAGGGRGGPP